MTKNKPLLDVLHGRKPARRPIWFMRQAGRYLPEYRSLREKAGSFLDLCYDPKLAAEVTLQPLSRFDFDAAIVFADILIVPDAMGLGVRFEEGEGPIVERVEDEARIGGLRRIAGSAKVARICETLARVKDDLSRDVALIGFCGAPWTVATYIVGGSGSKGREHARAVAYRAPTWFDTLLQRLVDESIAYLVAQIDAGAEVIQIFDSWAGDLPGSLQEKLVAEPIAQIVASVKRERPGVPVIVFARGAGANQAVIRAKTGADCLGIETSLPLAWVREHLVPHGPVQGNLDPVALECGGEALACAVRGILAALPADHHIFNLGHGVRPSTPLEHVAEAVRLVREFDIVSDA